MIFRDLQHEDGEDISVRMMVTTEEVMAVRLLQTNDTDSACGTSSSVSTELSKTMMIFLPFLFCGFLIFCVLRKKFPRIYAVRQWVEECRTPLADDQFGYFSWTWKIYSYTSDQLMEAISLDALCFLRLMNMGFRLSCVGCLNSIWLFPVYATADEVDDKKLDSISINALQDGSQRYLAPVLASYIFFGYAFYTIFNEFRWFIEKRHAWLQRLDPRNYTMLVRNIPEVMRSDLALKEHFSMLYGDDRVLEAHCCLFLGNLESMVAKRKACIGNLEHALAALAMNGKRPRHRLCLMNNTDGDGTRRQPRTIGADVDSIDYYTNELNSLNEEIGQQIDLIEKKVRPRLGKGISGRTLDAQTPSDPEPDVDKDDKALLPSVCFDADDADSEEAKTEHVELGGDLETLSEETEMESSNRLGFLLTKKVKGAANVVTDRVKTVATEVTQGVKTVTIVAGKKSARKTKKIMKNTQTIVTTTVEAATSLITGQEDGTPDDAGFVTFKSLVAVNGALQMEQHPELFALETEIAPSPNDIFWGNVGKDRGVIQTGRYASVAATVTLCLSWTFIVTFIVNLTNVDCLAEDNAQLERVLARNPWLESVLQVISPLLLLIFNEGLLPVILKAISRFEFPASDASLEASAFWKMAAFSVIQTFFISLISGSISTTIVAVLGDPEEFVNLLASELPSQSQYFMQLLTVSSSVGALNELFRITPLVYTAIRAHIGRHLTEKERKQKIGPFRPLSVVGKIYFSTVQAGFLLYFMVLFVYFAITPLLSWFCLFFIMIYDTVYRHQFIFNYPKTPDSGGEIWLKFMYVLLICIEIAQITLWGILGLKMATTAVLAMIPLFVISFLCTIYIARNYFSLGKHLPAYTCIRKDIDNADEGVDFTAFHNLYKNPALMERFVDADWHVGEENRKSSGETVANEEQIELAENMELPA